MQATLNGTVIAEATAEEAVRIEGNWYFPRSAVVDGALTESPTPYTCPWKGAAQYYDVVAGDDTASDGAWAYPNLIDGAVERAGRDFAGYVAFGSPIVVTD